VCKPFLVFLNEYLLWNKIPIENHELIGIGGNRFDVPTTLNLLFSHKKNILFPKIK
jgi:hypothetical protein